MIVDWTGECKWRYGAPVECRAKGDDESTGNVE